MRPRSTISQSHSTGLTATNLEDQIITVVNAAMTNGISKRPTDRQMDGDTKPVRIF